MSSLRIEIEETPNPETLKFLLNIQVLKGMGAASFSDFEEAKNSPMAQHILHIDGVKSVFLASNFISVTKKEEFEWDMLSTNIQAAIMDHISAGYPIMIEEYVADYPNGLKTELEKQISDVIDLKIRPAVQADGGDIEMCGFEDGVVFVRMQGACSGCPQSLFTLKAGIERTLKHFVPEVVSVEQV
ncbi:Fe/S biogenesis protein NifU-like protein [Candidatus Cyrtobacter comes]|uniref:Fe/S biogenesis protein NifU-like protein n=1 Tax=Candidatus Cyrtobacter comes TaxID=675776 RepID=A0ABU5L9L4_9RICK|nr:NifU family protein [Candidatus Cyrtobacter comes]MDZ5762565.1 Fe/S biogenesis protein NifU-like protein [Candidatus Cyrtobacter comes]